MPKRSDAAERILAFLRRYIAERGYAPSMREIAEGVALASPTTVLYHLRRLAQAGKLELSGDKSRAIRLTEPDGIPIVGRVAAGAPILAEEEIDGYLPWTAGQCEDCFALQVQGESMLGAGILPGDRVVVRRQPTAENGDIVVAMLDSEATVKHYRRTVEGGAVRVLLVPDNPAYVPLDGTRAEIVGKVIAVVRQYEKKRFT